MPYQLLADVVLLTHVAVVLFVVLGLPAIVVGNRLGWHWSNWPVWRYLHLAAIAVVVAQAWLGQYCFLTHWETHLRIKAGQTGYEVSFIEHWVQRVLYFDAPLWVFACLYSMFGALVAWAWWRYPPR
jgi:hypothetical protein